MFDEDVCIFRELYVRSKVERSCYIRLYSELNWSCYCVVGIILEFWSEVGLDGDIVSKVERLTE